MAVANNDILRIVCKLSWGEDDIQNVYHMKVTATGEIDNDDALTDIAAFMDDAYDDIDSKIVPLIDFDSIEVWNLTDESYVGVADWPTMTIGGGTGTPMPPQAAPLLLFDTDYAGSQGKKFLPPFVAGTVDTDGTLTASAIIDMIAMIATLIAGMTGTYMDGELGNWNDTLARFATWLSGTARDMWATQRRRYFGSGA